MTKHLLKAVLQGLLLLAMVTSYPVVAGSEQLEAAVEKYYAGFPHEAISMIEPAASSGDVDAQYLLGNILYSLSQTGRYEDIDDPIKWYKMAADQDSAVANYAIAAIFHNKWLESRNEEEAATAITYYLQAIELGYTKAQAPLDKLKYRSRISEKEAATLALQLETASVAKPEPESQVLEPEPEPEPEPENPESNAAKAPEPASTEITEPVQQSEPVNVTETASEGSNLNTQIADLYDSDVATTVTLTDLARHCSNFTATGFNLYVDTIRGAVYSGDSSVVGIKPEVSAPGSYSLELSRNQYGIAVMIDLRKVPQKVAMGLKKGDKSAVAGVIVGSKVVGTDCVLFADYQ